MRRLTLSAIGFALLLNAGPALAAQPLLPDSNGYGVHPYDVVERKPGFRSNRERDFRGMTYAEIYAFENSIFRTRTHALHPYFRHRYPDTSTPAPLEDMRTLARLGVLPTTAPSQVSGCSNYSYRRNFQFMPAYDYVCNK